MSQRNKEKKQARAKNRAFKKSGVKNHYTVWALLYFKRAKYFLCEWCLRSIFYVKCSVFDKNNFDLSSNLIIFSQYFFFFFFYVNLKA